MLRSDSHTIHIHTDGQQQLCPMISSGSSSSHQKLLQVTPPETAAEGFNSGAAAVGTGPYKFVSWEPKETLCWNEMMITGAAKGHGKGYPQEIPNDSSRLAALKAGQVDVINYVSSVDYLALGNDANIDAVKGDSVYIMNLQLDQRKKTPLVRAIDGSELAENPFRDLRVRQAIDHAIDRQTWSTLSLKGLADRQIDDPPGFFGSGGRQCLNTTLPRQSNFLQMQVMPTALKLICTAPLTVFPVMARSARVSARCSHRLASKPMSTRSPRQFIFQRNTLNTDVVNGWGTLTGEHPTRSGDWHIPITQM